MLQLKKSKRLYLTEFDYVTAHLKLTQVILQVQQVSADNGRCQHTHLCASDRRYVYGCNISTSMTYVLLSVFKLPLLRHCVVCRGAIYSPKNMVCTTAIFVYLEQTPRPHSAVHSQLMLILSERFNCYLLLMSNTYLFYKLLICDFYYRGWTGRAHEQIC